MNNSIQIFASDHRKDVVWNLPFIRITDNDSCISIKHDQFLYNNKNMLSEAARMIYAYKHLSQFGNPEYVGFCHYRRFFAICNSKSNIVIEDFDKKLTHCILNPVDQLAYLRYHNADGILEFPFLDCIEANSKYSTVVDMFIDHICQSPGIEIYDIAKNTPPNDAIYFWIKNFKSKLPLDLVKFFDTAVQLKQVYHSNIFTVRRDICEMYFQLLQTLIDDMLKYINENNLQVTNVRWLAYIIEYLYTNIFFNILRISGKFKFANCQLLVQ